MPQDKSRVVNLVAYRGTEEMREWLDGLTVSVGISTTSLVDMLLKEFAERRGYPAMPRRLKRRQAR
jgi:hypothetical protein